MRGEVEEAGEGIRDVKEVWEGGVKGRKKRDKRSRGGK